MQIIDYCVIAAYLILMVVIGIRCKDSSANISDYIRMGQKSTWWMAGTSLFMASFSAATFTGIAGQAFIAGWSVMLSQLLSALALFIQAAFMTSILRRTRAVTPIDVVRARFGPAAEQVKSWVNLLSSFFYAGFFLLGFGTFAAGLLHVPLWTVIVAMGFVVVFYSVSGGSWSVQITDSLQGLILLPVATSFTVLCLIELGGLGGLFDAIGQAGLTQDFSLIKADNYQYSIDLPFRKGNFTSLWLASTAFSTILGAFHIQTCHRYLSLPDEKSARKAAIFAGVLTLLGCFIWYIPPITGRLLFESDVVSVKGINNPADAAYAVTAMKMLPPGLIGLIFVCMLSATMSSMDGFLTGTAGVIVRNMIIPITRAFKRKEISDLGQLRLARGFNLLLGVWAIVMAFVLNRVGGDTGMFQVMQTMLVLVGSPSSVPFALALFYRKIPLWGLFAGIFSGIAFSTYLFIMRERGVTIEWGYEVLAMKSVCLIPTLISSFFWNHTSVSFRDHVDRFFELIKTPIDTDREVGKTMDSDLLKVVGTYAMTIGLMILVLVFWCRSLAEVLTITGISGFLVGIAILMRRKA